MELEPFIGNLCMKFYLRTFKSYSFETGLITWFGFSPLPLVTLSDGGQKKKRIIQRKDYIGLKESFQTLP